MPTEEFLTVADLSRLIRRSAWSIYADIAAGRAPKSKRVRGTILFRRADVDEWWESLPEASPVKPVKARPAASAG